MHPWGGSRRWMQIGLQRAGDKAASTDNRRPPNLTAGRQMNMIFHVLNRTLSSLMKFEPNVEPPILRRRR